MGIIEFGYLITTLLVGVLATVGYGVMSLTPPEIVIARRCFWVAAILFAGIGIVWGITTPESVWVRLPVVCVVTGLAVGGLTEAIRWVKGRSAGELDQAAAHSVNPALFESQLRELKEVDEFIGRKDENELRQTFDLQNMIKYNTLMAKGQLSPFGLLPNEAKEVDNFFVGGQAQIDVRYAKLTNVNNVAKYERIPGKFGLINLSKKYVEGLKRLNDFIASATIPDDVKQTLSDFKDTLTADTSLIFDVINDCFNANPNQVMQNDIYGSPFYGTVNGEYVKRFSLLRSKADSVSAAISKNLGISRRSSAAH